MSTPLSGRNRRRAAIGVLVRWGCVRRTFIPFLGGRVAKVWRFARAGWVFSCILPRPRPRLRHPDPVCRRAVLPGTKGCWRVAGASIASVARVDGGREPERPGRRRQDGRLPPRPGDEPVGTDPACILAVTGALRLWQHRIRPMPDAATRPGNVNQDSD